MSIKTLEFGERTCPNEEDVVNISEIWKGLYGAVSNILASSSSGKLCEISSRAWDAEVRVSSHL